MQKCDLKLTSFEKGIARNRNIENVLTTQITEDVFSLGSGILNVKYKLVILKVEIFFLKILNT